jgi:hypothetical protein
MSQLPPLEFGGNLDWLAIPSQESATKFSQMTPLHSLSNRFNTNDSQTTYLCLDIPTSSHSAGTFRLPSDLGRQTSPFGKSSHHQDEMPDFVPFQQDELDPIAGISLEFDGDGNLIDIIEPSQELPPLFDNAGQASQATPIINVRQSQVQIQGQEDLIAFGEEPVLPDADGFLPPTAVKQRISSETGTTQTTTETEEATAHARRQRPQKMSRMIDDELRIPRNDFREWHETYTEKMLQARKKQLNSSWPQARKNATYFLFTNGIENVGLLYKVAGFDHPLASEFCGTSLSARLNGREPEITDSTTNARRRKSDEAFKGEDDANEGRNVRQKTDGLTETGRGTQAHDFHHAVYGDDYIPECGMDAAQPLEDHHSSSLMPWSRQGSAVPGSSVRGPGSAQKPSAAPSPLLHGSITFGGSIERHSDPVGGGGGDDMHSMDSSLDIEPLPLDFDAAYAGLDTASHDFLGYAVKRILAEAQDPDTETQQQNRRWIDFADLARPERHNKAIAAQAFMHVLSLATKGAISVTQDTDEEMQPFGAIRIGVDVSSAGGQDIEMD